MTRYAIIVIALGMFNDNFPYVSGFDINKIAHEMISYKNLPIEQEEKIKYRNYEQKSNNYNFSQNKNYNLYKNQGKGNHARRNVHSQGIVNKKKRNLERVFSKHSGKKNIKLQNFY